MSKERVRKFIFYTKDGGVFVENKGMTDITPTINRPYDLTDSFGSYNHCHLSAQTDPARNFREYRMVGQCRNFCLYEEV